MDEPKPEFDLVLLDDALVSQARWEAVTKGKIQVLRELAKVVGSGDRVSSGYLAARCGLSVEEWHGSGELLAAVLFFAAEKGFLEWHANSMFPPPPVPPAEEED